MDKLPLEITANIFNYLDNEKDRSALVRAFDKQMQTGEVVPDPIMLKARELADPILDSLSYFKIKKYAQKNAANRNRVTRYFDDLYDRTVARFNVLRDVEKHELVERVYFMNGYNSADLTRIQVRYEPQWDEYGIAIRSMTVTPVEEGWDEYKIHESWQNGSQSSPNDHIYHMDWMIGQRHFRLDGPAYVEIINGVVRTELFSDAYQHKEIAYNEAGEIVAVFEDGVLTSDAGFFSEVFRPSIAYIPW